MPRLAVCPPPRNPAHNFNGLTVALALLATGGAALADEVHVGPGESIQSAIDDPATVDGTIIVVAPGTYLETLNPGGKAITLRGAEGPGQTVIDGNGSGPVVTCWSGEGPDTVIEGFTITGGSAGAGAGMWNVASSPTVRDCVFSGNVALFEGGGMLNEVSDPLVIACRFVGNEAFFGGGMSNILASPTVVNCLFSGNVADPVNGGTGGGVDNLSAGAATLVNCTFTGNTAALGGAVGSSSAAPALVNCILWGNSAVTSGPEVHATGSPLPTFSFCDVQGSGGSGGWDAAFGFDGGGNLDADPLFADPPGADGMAGTPDDDVHLLSGSPCIDNGDNTAVPAGVITDLEGGPRFADDAAAPNGGNGEGPIVDLGPLEVPAGPSMLVLRLDIRPRQCPNRMGGLGWLRMALLGREDFDVSQIDPESILLSRADGIGGSVELRKRPRRRDISAALDGDPCDCLHRGRDGHKDLVLWFRGRDLVRTLELERGESVELLVEGMLDDGTPFMASDCLEIGRLPRRWCRR